jgi:hypothetical protein
MNPFIHEGNTAVLQDKAEQIFSIRSTGLRHFGLSISSPGSLSKDLFQKIHTANTYD